MDYARLDDAILLGLIVDGQAGALDELYRRYGRLVYSVALHMVSVQTTAEEITFEVFMNVWQKAGTYRADKGNVRVWLSGIARNRSIDELRRVTARANIERRLWAEQSALTTSYERKAETAVDRQERKERLRAAINALSDEQRQVLALAYFQGYKQKEIAELCDLPLGTVKTRIRLGIQKLRQLLSDDPLF